MRVPEFFSLGLWSNPQHGSFRPQNPTSSLTLPVHLHVNSVHVDRALGLPVAALRSVRSDAQTDEKVKEEARQTMRHSREQLTHIELRSACSLCPGVWMRKTVGVASGNLSSVFIMSLCELSFHQPDWK